MNNRINLLLTVVLIGSLVGVVAPKAPPPRIMSAFIESGLLAAESGTPSVIVTSSDSAAAARAVERVGGQVTGDLWLVDAVAATVSADELAALATHPQVRSIVSNKGVEVAKKPAPDQRSKDDDLSATTSTDGKRFHHRHHR